MNDFAVQDMYYRTTMTVRSLAFYSRRHLEAETKKFVSIRTKVLPESRRIFTAENLNSVFSLKLRYGYEMTSLITMLNVN